MNSDPVMGMGPQQDSSGRPYFSVCYMVLSGELKITELCNTCSFFTFSYMVFPSMCKSCVAPSGHH